MSNNNRAFAQARQERDDEEIKAWEEAQEQARKDAEVDEIPVDNSDAAAWKKRQGDTRRAWQRDKDAAKAREAELLAEIEKLRSSSSNAVPVTEEELNEYVNKYPKVGALISRIVENRVNESLRGQEARLSKIEELENKLDSEEASKQLAAKHPDFFGDSKGLLPNGDTAIAYRADFNDWLREQDSEDQKVMDEGLDAKKASRIVNEWKAETGFSQGTKKKRNQSPNPADAASSVRTTSAPPVSEQPKGDYDFTESQIEAMSQAEYDALEEAIDKAVAAGRIHYDKSS